MQQDKSIEKIKEENGRERERRAQLKTRIESNGPVQVHG